MSCAVRIATVGVAQDYRTSLVPCVLKSLGYQLEWTKPSQADLLIKGPFANAAPKHQRWIPKPIRPLMAKLLPERPRKYRPLVLFQTAENIRHDYLPCDYALSFDLCVASMNHMRLPYWMEMVNWQHEGVYDNTNPRFGRLLKLERLMQPLGSAFLRRKPKVAFFSSHWREPRATLLAAVSQIFPVDGYGPHFDARITHHSNSGLGKFSILQDYGFNLCPENSMYPGYYTEKIPEAFAAGCLPLAWTDANVCVDFNPMAMVNLAPMMHNHFATLAEQLMSPAHLREVATCALLTECPSLEKLKEFLRKIVTDATS